MPEFGIENPLMCGALDNNATRGWGAAYAWCTRALELHQPALIGLSYGIFTFDTWSQRLGNVYRIPTHLFDCFNTDSTLAQYNVPYQRYNECLGPHATILQGRAYNTLAAQLATRLPLSTLVKLDVEGSEWDVLDQLPTQEFKKILLLDIEFHFCAVESMPRVYLANRTLFFETASRVLEKLLFHFYVTNRAPDRGRWIANTAGNCTGPSVTMLSVSYLNRGALV